MDLFTKLLEYYNITIKDHEERNSPWSFNNLKTPFSLPDFISVISRIENAIQNNEKTVIYGDYDVDGLTSVAILKSALDERGLNPGYYIPSRYIDGYGLNETRVNQFHDKGYHLIITVDNGITCFDSINLAKSYGMDVIVIDHHQESDVSPKYDFCFHQTKSGFVDYNCSAASLSFFVASKLLSRFDAYFATLAGVAVFSDVMPLVGNNLEFAKMTLYFIRKYKYPNLCKLLPSDDISYHDISFSLIPALNSIPRICKEPLYINKTCEFLYSKDQNFIKKMAFFIIEKNEERKKLTNNYKLDDKYTLESDHGICVVSDTIQGVNGLIANKLLKNKNKPAAVFSKNEFNDNELVASCRVPENYSLNEFLKSISDKLINGGGHKNACGLTINKKDYFSVCTDFISNMSKQALNIHDSIKTIDITIEDLNEENYKIYESFMPFGNRFEEPLFKITLDKQFLTIKKDTYAYISNFSNGKVKFFNKNAILTDEKYSYFEIYGNFSCDCYNKTKEYVIIADIIVPFE